MTAYLPSLRRGNGAGPMFLDSSSGWVLPRGGVASSPLTVRPTGVVGLARHPWFFRYTGEGGVPSRSCPSPLAHALASDHAGHPLFFSCTRRRVEFRLGHRRSPMPPDRGVSLFQEDPATPLLTSFTSRQGRVSAVASLVPDKEPLSHRFLPNPRRRTVSRRPPFHGSTQGRSHP